MKGIEWFIEWLVSKYELPPNILYEKLVEFWEENNKI